METINKYNIIKGTKYKVEDTYLEGVHSVDEFEVLGIDTEKDEATVISLRTGKLQKLPVLHDQSFKRSITNSLIQSEKRTTGFIFSLI